MLKIEYPIETFLHSLDSETYSVPTVLSESVFRKVLSINIIGEINKGNPAFTAWSKRLSYGEKLPRGKYFNKEERIRVFLRARLNKVEYTTILAS